MRTATRSRRLLAATATAALLLAACGGDDDTAADATADVGAADDETSDDAMGDMDDMEDGDDMEGMSDEEMADGSMEGMEGDDMEGMDHGGMEGMDMGSADAMPAYEMSGADLVEGDFALLAGAPEGYGFEDATGTGYLARTDDGTVATLEVAGLLPDTAYVSHVHAGGCDDEGGPHFKFDPDGADVPPNEIHLNFTTDADGAATWTATNEMVAGDDAVSIVIHAADGDTTKALCADLA